MPIARLDLSLVGPTPLELDPNWLGSRLDRPEKSLCCFTIGDRLRPRGYAPFLIHPSALSCNFGEKTVFSMPVIRYSMKGTPLCEEQTLYEGLFEAIHCAVGKRGAVFFEGVAVNSELSKLFSQPSSPANEYFHVLPYGPVYARRLIELPSGASFEAYLNTLGAATRRDIRRTRKDFIAGAKGVARVVRYTEAADAHELAEVLATISRKTYQYHLLGLGLENTPEHAEQLQTAAGFGWLRAYVLWIDDTPVAFQLGYCGENVYYGHHVGYDPAISKLQPGIYLHTEVMSDLLSDGISRFDFLSGDSLYKQRMSNTFREERHYYLIPRGWPGTLRAYTLSTVNFLSESVGSLLARSGWKNRLRQFSRTAAVKRAGNRS